LLVDGRDEGFYAYWPLKTRAAPRFRALLAPALLRALCEGDYFLLPVSVKTARRERRDKVSPTQNKVKFGQLRDGNFPPSPRATRSLRELHDKPPRGGGAPTEPKALAARLHFTESELGCHLLHGFCARHFTMLDVPAEIGVAENLGIEDDPATSSGASGMLRPGGSATATVSPAMVRAFLASNIAVARAEVEQHGERMAAQLLCFCLADAFHAGAHGGRGAAQEKSAVYRAALKEMRGVPLLVTADGNVASLPSVVGSVRSSFLLAHLCLFFSLLTHILLFAHILFASSSSRMRTQSSDAATSGGYVLATEELRRLLLPALAARVVLLELQADFAPWLARGGLRAEEMGLTWCDPLVLAHQMDRALPPAWKGASRVQWEPGQHGAPTRLWLRRFWSFVSIDDPHAVAMFRQWPLIPTKSGELIGCAAAAVVLAVDATSADGALLALLDAEDDVEDDVEDDGAEEDEAALGVDESATESAADADARTTSAAELPAPPLPPPPLPTGAPDVSRSAAAATASRAASVAALEPAALHALLACVGVPLLELAFFRRGGADLRLANAPPCELPRRIIRALALVARLPRRITASSTSRSLTSAGAGAPNWSALGAAQRDALLTALAHPDALLAPADLEELKRFALFRIPSGEHVSIDSGGFYTSSEEVRCSFLLFAAILLCTHLCFYSFVCSSFSSSKGGRRRDAARAARRQRRGAPRARAPCDARRALAGECSFYLPLHLYANPAHSLTRSP
jgi:hypothetical protein